jgi:hypothetical protein
MSEASFNGVAIEKYLNPAFMRAVFQTGLPIFGNAVKVLEGVRIGKVQRNSSIRRNPNPMTLCYELAIRNKLTGKRSSLHLYGKVFRDAASTQLAQTKESHHLTPHHLLIWAWPADPGLPQLPKLLDLRATQAFWNESAQQVGALRYVPERRATLCFTRQHGDPQQRQLFVKTFATPIGAEVFDRFRHFWELSQNDSDAPLVAKPLAYCVDTHSVWQASASGSALARRADHLSRI